MKPPPGMVFIYALIAQGEGPRYIGVTRQALRKRLAVHLSSARRGDTSTHKAAWLRKCLREERKVSIVLVAEVAEVVWAETEREAIRLARKYGNLTNSCDGGRGVYRLSPDKAEERAVKLRGQKRSAEVCARISAAHLGIRQKPETIAKITVAAKSRPLKLYCKRGHPLFGPNLVLRHNPRYTERACRICHNWRNRQAWWKAKNAV